MRLIDADDLLAKVQENAPGLMNSGSTITKALIMAMINTKSVAPTIDAVPVVRCKDCRWYDEKISFCDNCHLPREQTFFCADGKRR